MQHSRNKINWLNTLFLTITPIVAIVGTVLLCVFGLVRWPTWVLAGGLMIATGLAITAGYHRLFSHKSYRALWPMRLLYLLFGAGAFEGSVLEWCTDHRNHHRYTDTERDPYNIKQGFWYAHIGWLIRLDQSKRDYSNVDDLAADKLVWWQHKFYVPVAAVMGFVLPALIAWLWGDMLGGLIIAGALRICVNQHLTFAINSVCHTFGKKNYSDRQSAVDNWVTALFTYGEGYHNFHHQFPLDYRNGVRVYHFDPAKWLINFTVWLGLANDLKRVSEHRIIKYRVQMQEKRLANSNKSSPAHNMMKIVRENLDGILQQIESLEQEYSRMRRQRKQSRRHKKSRDYREQIKLLRQQMRHAQSELKSYLTLWSYLLSYHTKKAVKVTV